jgi:hypothetical protein
MDIAEAIGCASDHAVLARAYEMWSFVPDREQPEWARARYLRGNVFVILRGMREQLWGELEKLGLLQRGSGAPVAAPVSGTLLQNVLVRGRASLTCWPLRCHTCPCASR